jgi:hypothetical protein
MGNTESSEELYQKAGELVLELDKFPKLDIGNRMGTTDYIDFLKMEEITHPIMTGLDIFKRYFIVMKLLVDGRIVLQTIFQRYSDNLSDWRGCGHFSPNVLLFSSCSNITVDTFELILSLLKGEENIIIKKEHNPEDSNYIAKKVSIFNQEKWDAACVIQKHWRECRYDPRFKMCEKVLINGLNDVMEEFVKEPIT